MSRVVPTGLQVQQRIGVLVAEHQPLVRAGLALIISEDARLDLVASCETHEEAHGVCTSTIPDVVVCDRPMFDAGFDVAASRVLVLTDAGARETLRLLERGAVGILPRDARQEAVLAGLQSASRGELVVRPDQLATASQTRDIEHLTDREHDVLRLLASAHRNDEIAAQLCISIGTVKSHTHAIYRKLGVSGRVPALRAAAERGLVSFAAA